MIPKCSQCEKSHCYNCKWLLHEDVCGCPCIATPCGIMNPCTDEMRQSVLAEKAVMRP